MPLPFGALAWFTATLMPATLTVVFRAPPVLAETVTVAVPTPLVPPLADAQVTVELDDHAHPVPAVTVSVVAAAWAGKLADAGDTE